MKVLFSTINDPPRFIYLPIMPMEGKFFELHDILYSIYRVVYIGSDDPIGKDVLVAKIYCTEVVDRAIIERQDVSPMAANVLSRQEEEDRKVKKIDAPQRSEPQKRSEHINQLNLGL